MDRFEMTDKLSQKAEVSYEEAKAALEASNWDLLDAMILLENKKAGRWADDESNTANEDYADEVNVESDMYDYADDQVEEEAPACAEEKCESNTTNKTHSNCCEDKAKNKSANTCGTKEKKDKENNINMTIQSVIDFFARLVAKGNRNYLEVSRKGEKLISIPLTLLVILVLLFAITVPLFIISLFLGCRYRFVGEDIGASGANKVLDVASDKAEQLKETVKDKINENK
ncbi:MAG: DUF4342 domain-containing protein [Christensenellaceae bacterium]|nr:DUF4342 domain-containing protein [Christensenellaceae bacterium]